MVKEALETISPIFRPGSSEKDLESPGVFVGVSVMPSNPLLCTEGSKSLITFLAALPHPSVIIIGDSLNVHNVKAMWKNLKKPPTEEKAMSLAMEAGVPFRKFLGDAIHQLESSKPEKLGWITLLGFGDIHDEGLKERQKIARKYYDSLPLLRERIDEIATKFLVFRRPLSKNHSGRLPHMVAYLLAELPWLVAGFEYGGCDYRTLLYPTTMSKLIEGGTLANAMWDLTHDIHTMPEFLNLRQDLVQAAGGREVIPGVPLLPLPPLELGTDGERNKTEVVEKEMVTDNKQKMEKIIVSEKQKMKTDLILSEKFEEFGLSKDRIPELSVVEAKVRKMSIKQFNRQVSSEAA